MKAYHLVISAVLFFSNIHAIAGNLVEIPDAEFDGGTSHTIGVVTLPPSVSFSAEVRVDASDQWRHLIEVGGKEHGWNAPFRLEVGEEGQWYLSLGDGSDYREASAYGSWTYGQWIDVRFTYAGGVARLFENGDQILELDAGMDITAVSGSTIVGSFQGETRFFEGAIRNAELTSESSNELLFGYEEDMDGEKGFRPTKGRQIGSVSMAGVDAYTLTFWIKPLETIGTWASILQIGDSNEERQPALFFYPSQTRIQYRQATSQSWNSGFDPSFHLPIGEWTSISINWANEGQSARVRIYYSGSLRLEETYDSPAIFSEGDIAVWASTPWFNNARVRLADIRIHRGSLSEQELADVFAE